MPRFVLIRDRAGYALKDQLSSQHPLRIDFLTPQLDYRRKHGGRKELLLKAVNVRPGLKVWDCTAGLGIDSFLLALQGCEVRLFERSKILALLLEQAIVAAAGVAELQAVMHRMNLIEADSRDYLRDLALDTERGAAGDVTGAACEIVNAPDVILIDPMFPTRGKQARVKGAMQVLQRFLPEDCDAELLLELALRSGCPRTVVKRPARGAGIEGFVPTFSLVAKASRFDVFLNPGKKNTPGG